MSLQFCTIRAYYYSFISVVKIHCNNCAKTYLVSSRQIGRLGRKVRCANCNHTWHEYLQESDELCTTGTQERRAGGRSFLVFATLAFVIVSGLCIAIANPREMGKVYKMIGSYKDSISHKLGYKKKQTDSPDIKRRLAASKFYQGYLFLTHLRSS